MRVLSILVALSALLFACMGPTFVVQQYNGPARPRESIAILRVNGADSVRLLFLDEEDVAAPLVSDGRLHIELLPGKHTLTARNGEDRTAPSGSFAFQAEPGKVYRVIFSGDTGRLFEVDRDSDKPSREITAPPPAAVSPAVSAVPSAPATPATPAAPPAPVGTDAVVQ